MALFGGGGNPRLQELGRRLWGNVLGRKPKKAGEDRSGLPPPPDLEARGEFIQEQTPAITQQARQEEGQRAGIMQQEVGDLASELQQTDYDIGQRSREDIFASQQAHAQNQQDIQRTQQVVADLPGRVTQQVHEARADLNRYLGTQIGAQEEWAKGAMADVSKGQSMAMEAAVQSSQATINNQIAQINANPDIPPSQKQQMINQVRMQGAMQMGPIIGSTILEFNKLHADTAVNFGNQLTSLRGAAVGQMGQFETAGMGAITGAQQAAAQMGSQLTQLQVNDRNQYIADRNQIHSARFQAENSNNQLMLAMLPEYESTVPIYSSIMQDDLAANVLAMSMDNEDALKLYGMQLQTIMQQMQQQSQRFNALSGALSMIPGPAGMIASAGVGLLGAFQKNPAPQPGWGF